MIETTQRSCSAAVALARGCQQLAVIDADVVYWFRKRLVYPLIIAFRDARELAGIRQQPQAPIHEHCTRQEGLLAITRRLAEMMDGRRLTASTTDFDEKRLLNVVEEMALASGVPVPLVYVMDDEAALNAFAAGHTPHDAAIAVTHGLMKSMNRDEMQGVIAHEFSHILNGDMRLNLRMIGLLFGIEMIGHAGRLLLDGNSRSRSRDSSQARTPPSQVRTPTSRAMTSDVPPAANGTISVIGRAGKSSCQAERQQKHEAIAEPRHGTQYPACHRRIHSAQTHQEPTLMRSRPGNTGQLAQIATPPATTDCRAGFPSRRYNPVSGC